MTFKSFDVTLKNTSESTVIFFDNSCGQGYNSFLFQISEPVSTYLLKQRLWWRSITSKSEIPPNNSVVYPFELASAQLPKTDIDNNILVKYHQISDGSIYTRRDYSKVTYSVSMQNFIEPKDKKYPHIFEEDLFSESIKYKFRT